MGSTTMRRILDRARRDDDIKAVVLRVNSPGGSALASDIIWEASRRLNETKPLIVSMGDVAASGGYYISVGSATIFADPATLTGSIGVVGGKLVTKGLWDWAGVNFYTKSYGKNADLFSTHKQFTEQQRETFRSHMSKVYKAFKDRVLEGRRNELSRDLEELAGGRVYTGRQAKAKGLVDRLGGLREAIACAAEQAELEEYELLILPERKNFMEMLFEPQGTEDDENLDGPAVLQGLLIGKDRHWLSGYLQGLARLDPIAARSVIRSLLRIELLGKEQTLLVLPGELNIR
jgi:protease-4